MNTMHTDIPKTSTPQLSIVVPMYNEEENIKHFVKRVVQVVAPLELDYELLLVDDGSRDGTWLEIQTAAQLFKTVRGIRLARNFGHQSALLAGLRAAKGQAVISMDGDLQHPPEMIPELLKAWKDGARVVSTTRTYSKTTSAFKRFTSSLYYRIFSYLSEVPMKSGQSDFRLLDRSALEQLLSIRQSDIFLRGAVSWLNYPETTIPFVAADRLHGESKYPLSKMLRFARGGILAFSTKPLQIGIAMGLMTSVFSFAYLVYILVQHARGQTVEGWSSTLGLLSLLFGVLFIMLGIVGTYLGRIYIMLQQRPQYVLEDDDRLLRKNESDVQSEPQKAKSANS
ncbi:glycosyltransferase family 2 protein [Massilia sp. Mn16-1_5]|uniref:glycosyltransferase family 2 protein n=1 Tax=Massilia sp. Mn16-1_5 TaxID=2079199 RepID=UPI00109E834E|nr:glycosyltransferase family 2 protein [Massilia sp. Mn16-1_5]THC45651.1 glycosyltransferase [Massilia sp. Mn16-1_5]